MLSSQARAGERPQPIRLNDPLVLQHDPVVQLIGNKVQQLTQLYNSNPFENWNARVTSILLVSAFCTRVCTLFFYIHTTHSSFRQLPLKLVLR